MGKKNKIRKLPENFRIPISPPTITFPDKTKYNRKLSFNIKTEEREEDHGKD
jgi:hypothetical protein